MKRTVTLILCLISVQWSAFGFDKGTFRQQQSLSFEENKGQITDQKGNPRTDIDYILKAPGLDIFIGKGVIHYQFYKTQPERELSTPINTGISATTIATQRIDVLLMGSNMEAGVLAENAIGGMNHYYTNPKFKNGVATRQFQKITYKNIYPGIDWVLYIQNGGLEYDFIVHPGASTRQIQLSYKGATQLNLTAPGTLQIATTYGTITEQAPVTYQQVDHKPVASHFKLTGDQLSFEVNNTYQGTLVIDPGVIWATYYGGGPTSGNAACDPYGYVYLYGSTPYISTIATTGSYQDTFPGGVFSSFLVRFDSLGNRLWATYYGGDSSAYNPNFIQTQATGGVACDHLGHVYMAGWTNSSIGIATPGSHQDTATAGGTNAADGYLVQFDTAGIRQWGTYYGGNNKDMINSITCDRNNAVYISGQTLSTNGIATPGCYQDTMGFHINAGFSGRFIAKFSAAGSLQWGTYYGDGNGVNNTSPLNIACDNKNNIYFTSAEKIYATTNSGAFATPGTYQSTASTSIANVGYLVKFDSTGGRQWGTFFYGNHATTSSSVSCDTSGHVYISGITESDSGIATPGSYDSSIGFPLYGNVNFLAQFTSTGQRNWGTYYGSSEQNSNFPKVACDVNGRVYMGGITNTTNLLPFLIATPYSYQDSFINSSMSSIPKDAFLVQFDSTGIRHWATYYGAGGESNAGVACDTKGNVYLSGTTTSTAHIATPSSYQDTLGVDTVFADSIGQADQNVFLVRFVPVDIKLSPTTNTDTICSGLSPFAVTLYNQGRLPEDSIEVTCIYTNNSTGATDTLDAITTQPLNAGSSVNLSIGNLNLDSMNTYALQVYVHHVIDDSSFTDDTLYTTLVAIAPPFVNDINVTSSGGGNYSFNADSVVDVTSYHWSFGDGGTANTAAATHTYAASGNYTVTLVCSNSCKSDTVTTTVAVSLGIASVAGTVTAINLYPNPNNGEFTLSGHFNNDGVALIRIMDITGRVLYTAGANINNGTLNKQIVTGHALAPGMYMLRISDKNNGASVIPFEVFK